MKHFALMTMFVLLPFAATAQTNAPALPTAAAAEVSYAKPVERIEITGAHTGLLESGSAAGGYSLIYRTSVMGSNIFTHTQSRLTNSFRYVGATADAPLQTGACTLRSDGRSLFGVDWDQRTTQLYACEIAGKDAADYALEVALPAFRHSSFSVAGISVSADGDSNDAATQAILRGRLTYNGVRYEALPTGFGTASPLGGHRVVQGYLISRDGAPVGRIDFQNNTPGRGVITAPVADADGREAVLFMALNLLVMPDLYAPTVRESVLR